MKVYVSQGHEYGIGLEVFFKFILTSTPKTIKNITLLAFPLAVESTLKSMKVPHKIERDRLLLGGITIEVEWSEKIEYSQSLTTLKRAMRLAEKGGVLFTLPTSKDQFQGQAGHTEYFRHAYGRPDLGMFFSSQALQMLLLSDHIPLSEVTKSLSTDVIHSRLLGGLRSLKRWHWRIERTLVSGFNPHAGEGGIIGREDERVIEAIKRIKSDKDFEVSGPFPGDTMLLARRSVKDLLVYLYHDQGLGVFKGLQGLVGSNITLGLPYLRFSPDHGTSFQLYGKNSADYRGCAYSIQEALSLAERISNAKDTSQ